MLHDMLSAGLTTGVILIGALIYRKYCKWWNKKHPTMKHSKSYKRWQRKRLSKMSADDMINRMGNNQHYAAVQPWPDDKDNVS